MNSPRNHLYRFLRWSERYTRTDMVYLFRNSSWVNLNFLFVSLFSFLLSIAFANVLTKNEYGTYQYLLSVSALLTAFTFTGFSTAITQSVARGFEGTWRASIRPQALWNLVPAIAALLWGTYYFSLGQTLLGTGLVLIGITMPVISISNSYAAFLAGKEDFKTVSLYVIASNAVYYICIFACIVLYPRALPLLFVNLLVTTGASIFFYFRTLRIFRPGSANDPSALPFARHLSIINTLSTVAAQIDGLLVFHFLGASELALYSLAALLPERLGGLFKSVTTTTLPRFAKQDSADLKSSFYHQALIFGGITVVVAGAYSFLAPFVFHVIYPSYSEAIPYSQFYALTLTGLLATFVTSAFSAHKKIRELYILNTIIPIVQIAIQVIGILVWGIWGLIAAKIISGLVSSVGSLFLFYRSR